MNKNLRRFLMGFTGGILLVLSSEYSQNNLANITKPLFWVVAIGSGLLFGLIVFMWFYSKEKEDLAKENELKKIQDNINNIAREEEKNGF